MLITRYWSSATGRRGVVTAWTVVALMTLVGMGALVIDIGQLVVAAQRAQQVADGAALASACDLPCAEGSRNAALAVVAVNNDSSTMQVNCADDGNDLVYYQAGDNLPGYGALGPWACGMRVSAHVSVEYKLARVVGLEGSTATRSATVLRAPVAGLPICTMWIAEDTPLDYDQPQQLLMADGPHYAGIPGSFGFLQSPDGCTASFFELLQGYNLSMQDVETSFVHTGNTVYAETGEMVGQWKKALESHLGQARLERGTSGQWADDTFESFHPDNPRIILVPMVSYLGGTGSNAAFRIEKFGAFWLEEVNPGQKEILGRFIEYDFPGGDPDGAAISTSGVFATRLVH